MNHNDNPSPTPHNHGRDLFKTSRTGVFNIRISLTFFENWITALRQIRIPDVTLKPSQSPKFLNPAAAGAGCFASARNFLSISYFSLAGGYSATRDFYRPRSIVTPVLSATPAAVS